MTKNTAPAAMDENDLGTVVAGATPPTPPFGDEDDKRRKGWFKPNPLPGSSINDPATRGD